MGNREIKLLCVAIVLCLGVPGYIQCPHKDTNEDTSVCLFLCFKYIKKELKQLRDFLLVIEMKFSVGLQCRY